MNSNIRKFAIILLVTVVFVSLARMSFAQDNQTQKIHQMINEFVEQAIINTLLSEVGKTYTQAIQQQNIQMLPQSSYQAVQQTVLHSFKDNDLKEYIVDAYEKTSSKARQMFDEGKNQSEIQNAVKTEAESLAYQMMQDKKFQFVANEMLKKAHQQSVQIIGNMALRQQYIQQVAVQQQVIQQAIQAQYKQIIQHVMQQHIQQQMVNQVLQSGN